MRYSEELSKMLGAAGATEGCKISFISGGREYKGILMPHKDSRSADVIVIKMRNGYKAGFTVDAGTSITILEQPSVTRREAVERKPKKGLPNLVLIGTGGTIGSQTDVKTGALAPGASTDDILNMFPEILEIANVRTKDLFSVLSENMNIEHWQKMAAATAEELNDGADGVIILHGTDTLGYSAAALSFMLREISGPVVLVGSQRSPDRPSSDAFVNLMASVRFCSSKTAGVYVIMHDTMSDDSCAVHRGTRVRKMHTSRRDAFRSINAVPVARMDADGKITFRDEVPKASSKTAALTKMEKDAVLIHYYPGMDPKTFRNVIVGRKGAVIAGSGLGHVSDDMVPILKEAADKGTVIVMTSQCINGPTGLNIYNKGRELQDIGVISVSDMLPETAYVKLMWALANTKDKEEAKELMRTKLAYEMGDRRTVDVVW